MIFTFFNNAGDFDMSAREGDITWQQFTGIKQAGEVGDAVVLPTESFSPGAGQMGAGGGGRCDGLCQAFFRGYSMIDNDARDVI